MCTEIKLVRPAVISKHSFEALDDYRGFRHIVRNVYAYNLSLKKLKPLIEQISSTYEQVENEIISFVNILEETSYQN